MRATAVAFSAAALIGNGKFANATFNTIATFACSQSVQTRHVEPWMAMGNTLPCSEMATQRHDGLEGGWWDRTAMASTQWI